MNRQRLKRFFILFLFILILSPKIWAEDLKVIYVSGNVLKKKGENPYSPLKKNETVKAGALVRTGKDSEVILRDSENYYKLYAYSKLKLESTPSLAYGKMSKASGPQFLNLHFYFTPQPAQGKTLKVVVRTIESPLSLQTKIVNEDGYKNGLDFFELEKNTYRALTGFDVEAPAVKYMLQVTAENKKNSVTEIIYPFYLKKTVQKRGKVFLANEKRALLEPSEQKTEERQTLGKILYTDTPQPLWEKTFIYPVKDPVVISPFGKRRLYYINNTFSFVRFHRGIDFKGMRGDPVYSPNNGVVVFAGMRITTGYTVVIDHGHGVFSLFFHLDSIDCEEGMFIQKGELISRIGSTGITEGPHLHWGLFVNGIYVDPADWVERSF